MSTRYQKCNGCGSPGEVSANGYCSKCQTKESAWYEDVWSIPVIGPVLGYAGAVLVFGAVGTVMIGLAAVGILPIVAIAGGFFVVVVFIVKGVKHLQTTAPARQAERERREVVETERKAQLQLERTRVIEEKMTRYRRLRAAIEATELYKKWREDVFKEFGRACVICHTTEGIEVDHRYRSFYAIVQIYKIENVVQAYECQVLWDVDNGAPLCREHHSQTKSSVYYNEIH